MNIQTQIKEGIVRGGETLKEHRDKVMEATRRTGHYAGLRHMELRDEQPILYNKLFSRLRAGVVDAARPPRRSPPAPSSSRRANCASPSTTPPVTAS